MSSWTKERAKIAGLTRQRPPGHPDLVEARRDLRAARLAMRIEETVAGWPPLTAEQKASLAILLLSGQPDAERDDREPVGAGDGDG